jgi:hypothetical protein
MQVPFPLSLFFFHKISYDYGDGTSLTKEKALKKKLKKKEK